MACSSQAAAIEIDDLDVDATPEDIMLSYVSGDKSKDRTDRTMVTPWFRFLWEAYRNLLDILRHNSRLQTLYALSIKRAFAFCVSYKRTSEFRRLCELLRSHLANIQKRAFYGKDQKDRPDLTMVETLQLYVETRFEQLKVQNAPIALAFANMRNIPSLECYLEVLSRFQFAKAKPIWLP